MFLAVDTSITIRAAPEAIWDFASRPENWTASNPREHFGLRYFSPDNLPHERTEFEQLESVAGLRATLRGRFHYLDRPRLAFWSGIATYRLLGGLIRVRLAEGGVLRTVREGGATRLSHDVYIDFPDSTWGRFVRWAFERLLAGRQAVYDHAYRELEYFKTKLDDRSGA
jgi:hypothetical protein